jgi:hypothetical protein
LQNLYIYLLFIGESFIRLKVNVKETLGNHRDCILRENKVSGGETFTDTTLGELMQ